MAVLGLNVEISPLGFSNETSILLYPVIPSSIDKALNIYNLTINNLNLINLDNFSPSSILINKPEPLFPRIEL